MSLTVQVFATLAPLPILVALIIGAIKFGMASKAERYLIVLMALSFVAQLLATIFWWLQMNNMLISHILTPIEFFLIAWYLSFFVSISWRFVLRILALVFVIFAGVDYLYHESITTINAPVKGAECLLLIGISLLVWVKIMRELAVKNIFSLTLFWVNSAVLIYFSANCMLFIYSEFVLLSKPEVGLVLWAMHLVFMTIYYLLISIGLWKIRQKSML